MTSMLQAWYRRGKANAALGNYEDAVNDLNVAKNMELSLGGKRQIESEIKIIVDQNKDTSRTLVQQNESYLGNFGKIFTTFQPSKCYYCAFLY